MNFTKLWLVSASRNHSSKIKKKISALSFLPDLGPKQIIPDTGKSSGSDHIRVHITAPLRGYSTWVPTTKESLAGKLGMAE